MRCLMHAVLYTELNAQCDEMAAEVVGRTSTVASIVNFDRRQSLVYYTERPSFCRTSCHTLQHDRRFVVKFSESRISDNVPRVSTRVSGRTRINTVWNRSNKALDGSVAEWLACRTHVQKGLGSNRSRDAVG